MIDAHWLDEDDIKTGDLVRIDWTKKEFMNCCSRGNISPNNGGCPNIYDKLLNNMFPYCKNKIALVVKMKVANQYHINAYHSCGCVNDYVLAVQPIGKKEIYWVDKVAANNGMSRV